MTITTEPAPLSYSGNDSTTNFAITWMYFAKADVVATLRSSTGTETTWVLNTHYTLTDAGVDTGGTLTATTPPATNETLVISLDPSNTQDASLPRGGAFPSSTVEDALDKSAQRDAKIEQLWNRALRVPTTDLITGTSLELPIDSSRASKFLAFNASGNPIASVGTDSTITAAAQTVLDDTTVAAMVDTLGGAASTGTGGLVRKTSATLVTPALGTPASGVLTNCTGLPLAGMANLAQDLFIGRVTASTGVPETATITAFARTLVDYTTSNSFLTTLTATRAEANAVAVTAISKFRARVSLVDFGAVFDGTTDDTAAWTAAVAALPAGGGIIDAIAGISKVSSVTFNKPCLVIGQGIEVTIIKASSATATVFSATVAYVFFARMSFQTSIARTAGAYVHFTNTASVCGIKDFMMTGQYLGILQEATSVWIKDGRLVDGATTSGSGGIKLDKASAIDTRIDSITMDAPVGSQPTFGINLLYADATMITNCDVIHHTSNLLVNPITATVVTGTYIENSFFDSAVQGLNMPATLAGTVQFFRAKACWFGNQTSQGVYMSTTTGVIDGVDFDECYMALNDDYGQLVDPGCLNVKVNGGQYAANLQGIGFGANVTHCSVIGARIGTVSAQAGNTNYGIIMAASNDYMTIKDNNLVGNGVAAMSNASTGAHNLIYDNLGHVPTPIGVTANIPIGAVAYGSLGTAVSHVAGTIYVAEIYIPHAKAITGIAILNAGTVGTSLGIVALYGPDGGAALATSALAGTVSANANALQSIPFTAALTIWQPGRYFIAFQANNATDNIRCIAASTYLNWTKSFTGVFGTIASLTVPTSTAADVGPIGLVY